MSTLLVLIDFTDTSFKALDQAIDIAFRKNLQISLFHCLKKEDIEAREKVEEMLIPYSDKVKAKGLRTSHVIAAGDLFEQTKAVVNSLKPWLVIAGNHGVEGLDHRHLGSAIHKLIQQLAVPTLLLSHNSKVVEGGFRRVMMPAAPHSDFHIKVEAAAKLMAEDGTMILLAILDEGVILNADSAANMQAAQKWLDSEGIAYDYREVPAAKHAIGYADQTLQIMNSEEMDLISIMATISDAHRHFGKIDKERVLLADEPFQVLCANGAKKG